VVLALDSRTAYVDVVVAIENPNEAGVNAPYDVRGEGTREGSRCFDR
jgi:hypothetical protein